MTIEEAVSNPATLAQKSILDAFPVRHVLGLLQRNERLSEQLTQPAPASFTETAYEHQGNQHANTQASTKSEEIVSGTPSSQLDDNNQGDCSSKGEDAEGKVESKTCFKCGKTFASWQGLRGHLNRIRPCDQEKIVSTVIRRRLPASRTCSKCGKTFSSPQSLRIHMNRVKPCDQDSKNMSDPTTPPGTTNLTLMTGELRKEAERKARARYQARKAYLKKRGRLGELGDPPSAICQSGDDVHRPKETETEFDLKRNSPDETFHEGENVMLASVKVKRRRVQKEPAQADESTGSPSDVCGLTQPSTSIPPHTTTLNKMSTTEGSLVHRSNKGHGGDLLAGGCSCPPCVRRWARKLMNRMQQLEDEVLVLRQKQTTDADTTRTASTKPHTGSEATQRQTESLLSLATRSGDLSHSAFGVIGNSEVEPADILTSLVNSSNTAATFRPLERGMSNSVASTRPGALLRSDHQSLHTEGHLGGLQRLDGGDEYRSVTASVLQGVNSDTKSLMDAYRHMNDQILLNERAVEESSGHVQILVGYSPTAAMDFRRQVNELRASICTEKSKRDVTVAALIAHVWKPRREEFKALLSAQSQSSPCDEQVFHAKWAEIANQIFMKDEIISNLERRMEALGESGGNSRCRYAEMGELSSKIAAEYAAKMTLESEREGFYVGLVKSNTRVRSLVRNALL